MKKFLLCIVLSFLVISCSNDSDFDNTGVSQLNGIEFKNNSKMPENRANPFDGVGKKYYELLSHYSKSNETLNSLEGKIKQIQFISKEITNSYTKKSSISVTDEQINWIMSDPQNSLTEILEVSALGTEAKLNLINFLKALIQKNGLEYVQLYDYIVSYEASILESSTLDEDEKESILTVSSVSRYALYIDPKHKDRDWELLVANRKANKSIDNFNASIISVIALLQKLV